MRHSRSSVLCGLVVGLGFSLGFASACGRTSRNASGGGASPDASDASVDAASDAASTSDAEPPESLPGHPATGSRCSLRQLSCGRSEAADGGFRMLTSEQFNYTVYDLLGVERESVGFPWGTYRPAPYLDDAELSEARELAESIASEAVRRVDELLDCAIDESEPECVERFIASRGRLWYREPVDDAERERLFEVYEEAGLDDLAMGVQAVLVELLSSSRFLMRSEMGRTAVESETIYDAEVELDTKVPSHVVALDGYELASRLSYWLWQSAPDEALLDVAASGELTRPAVLRREALRLLADDRFRRPLDAFNLEWLQLGQLDRRVEAGDLEPELAAAMREESLLLARDPYLFGEPYESLFTGTYTFANQALLEVYGDQLSLDLDREPDEFQRAGLLGDRPGLFTRSGWLAATGRGEQSAPVARASAFLRRQLCTALPAPPPEDHFSFEPSPTDISGREYLEREINPRVECYTCHRLIDGAGLAFEHYDGLGRYRGTDVGGDVDASGWTLSASDVRLEFDDAADLLRQVADLPDAYECLASQWLAPVVTEAPCSVRQAVRATCEQGNLPALIAELATTEAFRFVKYRGAAEYEVEGCDREGSMNCEVLAELTEVSLETCEQYQGAACDHEGEEETLFPCLGVTAIRGCCSDEECRRAGMSAFCGRGTSPHRVCVTSDAL